MSRHDIGAGGAGIRISGGGSGGNEKSEVVLDDFDRLFANLDPVKVPLYQGKNPKQQSAARVKEVIEIARARLEALSSVDSFGAKLDMVVIGRAEEKIQELLAAEKYEESLGYCDQIIMALPKDQGGYILKGQAYLNIDANIALVYLRKALELNLATNSERHRGDIYNFISIAFRKLGHFDDAIGYAQKAIDIYPDVTMYYLNKDVAIRDKYLYFNSLLTEPREERMKLTELIELKVTVLSRLSNIEARIGEDEVRGIKELMKGLSLLELSEENAREMAKELLEIANLISKVMETNGIKIDDGLSEALLALTGISEATVKAEPTKELRAAAGGAGEEEAQDMEIDAGDGGALSSAVTISASGGTTSFAAEATALGSASLTEEYDPELTLAIESAKKAIADAPKLTDEEERKMIKAYQSRPYNPEAAKKLGNAEKSWDWDKIFELLQEYKDAQHLGMYAGYSRDAVVQGNFKFFCKLIEKNPEFKDYLAQETLDSTISNYGPSEYDLFLKLIKLYEDLGLNVNELIIKKFDDCRSLLEKATSESKGEDYEFGREEFFEYFLKRFEDQNFKLDAGTIASVLKIAASSRDSLIIDRLIPMLKEGEDFPDVFKEMDEKVKENHAMLQEIWRKQEEAEKLKTAANLSLEGDNTILLGEDKDQEGTEA